MATARDERPEGSTSVLNSDRAARLVSESREDV